MGRLALQLALAGLVSLSSAIPAPRTSAHGARAPTAAKNVIVQMFEWDWDSIAAECTDFLGPNGYGFVQGQSKLPRSLGCKLTLDLQQALLRNTSREPSGGQTTNRCPTS